MSKTLKIILGALFFVYLLIQVVSFGLQGQKPVGPFEKVVIFFASPVQRLVSNVGDSFYEAYRHYFAITSVSKTNDELVAENIKLKFEISKLAEVENENLRLREMLNMPLKDQMSLIAVNRTAMGASPYQKTMRFKFNKNFELKRGMPIFHPLGVVGQVLDIHRSSFSFDALLLTDKTSAIDVLCERSRHRGILVGHNPSTLKFEYLEKASDIQIGDHLLSTGLDGIFPKGIPVGKVVYVNREGNQLFMEALVKPYVDFENLEEALVMVSPL